MCKLGPEARCNTLSCPHHEHPSYLPQSAVPGCAGCRFYRKPVCICRQLVHGFWRDCSHSAPSRQLRRFGHILSNQLLQHSSSNFAAHSHQLGPSVQSKPDNWSIHCCWMLLLARSLCFRTAVIHLEPTCRAQLKQYLHFLRKSR